MIRLITIFVLVWALPGQSTAHELRPGFLEIRQDGPATFEVRFKVPARGDLRLGLHVRLPKACEQTRKPRTEQSGGAFVDRFVVHCPGGLQDRVISIDGLAGTVTEVVARVALSDGTVQAARLTPDMPDFRIKRAATWADTARTYLLLGVEHILLGIDHLLFVLALLLLIRDPWTLVKTITAFTVAHSITLAAAALEWARAPQTPVEAVIALSIVFVAAETVRERRDEPDLASRTPWLVAFAFGLLHGFGFAGALKEIGLPQTDIPLALLSFNLGIEAGQLLFVAGVLALKTSLDRLLAQDLPWLRRVTGYGIGSLAGFWFFQRVAAML